MEGTQSGNIRGIILYRFGCVLQQLPNGNITSEVHGPCDMPAPLAPQQTKLNMDMCGNQSVFCFMLPSWNGGEGHCKHLAILCMYGLVGLKLYRSVLMTSSTCVLIDCESKLLCKSQGIGCGYSQLNHGKGQSNRSLCGIANNFYTSSHLQK